MIESHFAPTELVDLYVQRFYKHFAPDGAMNEVRSENFL
jgi:hypothetical protein